MNKRTKALQFSKENCEEIHLRDKRCVFCGMGLYMDELLSVDQAIHDTMHIVNKSQGGLGVVQNGVEGCRGHHFMMDNGKHPELREVAEDYLKSLYPGWTRESVTYNKYKDIVVYRKRGSHET